MSTPITQGIQSSESQEVCILWYFTTQTSFRSSITIQSIASQVRVTGAQRGKMGVSLDRSSDWWRKWRDIFGDQSHCVAMQLKQSRLGLSERYLNTLKCGDSASFSGKLWHEMSVLSIPCILRTFALEWKGAMWCITVPLIFFLSPQNFNFICTVQKPTTFS